MNIRFGQNMRQPLQKQNKIKNYQYRAFSIKNSAKVQLKWGLCKEVETQTSLFQNKTQIKQTKEKKWAG